MSSTAGWTLGYAIAIVVVLVVRLSEPPSIARPPG